MSTNLAIIHVRNDPSNHIWQQLVSAFENNQCISIIISRSSDDSQDYRKVTSFNIPSVFASDCTKLAAIIKIIKILKTNLLLNKTTTIRDIFYQDVEIFNKNSQECKTLLIDLVEKGLGWSLAQDFNTHPTQKGLMYGNIFKQLAEPTLIPISFCSYFKQTATVPPRSKLVVIVLEKDAILHSFSKFIETRSDMLNCNFLVITGKGFSDNLTQQFATWLTQTYHTTVLGFFDSDAHGILIYKQYKCAIPYIDYTGMYLLESHCNSQLTITTRDISIMTNLAATATVSLGQKVHRELTRGLFLNKKAEMNVVSAEEYNSYILDKVCKVVSAHVTTGEA
ncbi:SPO11 [Candida margitis]|uniref:SPO11 n=1 Tax=Candida margitis TaxID=1775924 RepID=UPI00222694B4|nr:SPO11 [Candida margitis]KAI5959981.1 SPO11 [Candida margitis]